MELQLQKHHYEDIGLLINISFSILKIYDKLCNLENSNKINSKEYNDCINELKSAKEIEKNILDRLLIDSRYINQLIDYFHGECTLFGRNILKSKSLINNNKKDLIFLRISEKIAERYISMNKEELDKVVCKMIVNDKEMMCDSNIIIDVDNEIFADLINTILLFINNYVKENIYKFELIKIKYNIIYVFERKENECIEYNFTTQNDLYWLTDFYCDVKDIPEDIKRACRNKRGYELYAMLIEDFIDKFDGIEKTYQEILLRTSLLFLNKDEALNIINEIMKIKNEADRLGINLQSGIFKVMESYEKDFLLPNIVRTRVKEK